MSDMFKPGQVWRPFTYIDPCPPPPPLEKKYGEPIDGEPTQPGMYESDSGCFLCIFANPSEPAWKPVSWSRGVNEPTLYVFGGGTRK